MKTQIATAVLACLALAGPGQTQEQPKNSDPSRGADLYAESCASCHGAKLEGQPNWRTPGEDGVLPAPPHDKTGHTWHHEDSMLFNYTKFGGQITLERAGITSAKSGMPGFEDSLSDQDIWDILAYTKSTWSKRERRVQQERTRVVKTLGD